MVVNIILSTTLAFNALLWHIRYTRLTSGHYIGTECTTVTYSISDALGWHQDTILVLNELLCHTRCTRLTSGHCIGIECMHYDQLHMLLASDAVQYNWMCTLFWHKCIVLELGTSMHIAQCLHSSYAKCTVLELDALYWHQRTALASDAQCWHPVHYDEMNALSSHWMQHNGHQITNISGTKYWQSNGN